MTALRPNVHGGYVSRRRPGRSSRSSDEFDPVRDCARSTMKALSRLVLSLYLLLGCALSAQHADNSLPGVQERALLSRLARLELANTDPQNADADSRWILRSRHFLFGMPRLVDRRHNFVPDGFADPQAGITVLAREAFVVRHFDRMKAPLWVTQRWTSYDSLRMSNTPAQGRTWHEDAVLPVYAPWRYKLQWQ